MADQPRPACHKCDVLLTVVADLITRLDRTTSYLDAERIASRKLKCLNVYLLDQAAERDWAAQSASTAPVAAFASADCTSEEPDLTTATSDDQDSSIEVEQDLSPNSCSLSASCPATGLAGHVAGCSDTSAQDECDRGCSVSTTAELVPSIHAAKPPAQQSPSVVDVGRPCSTDHLGGRNLVLDRDATTSGVINALSRDGLWSSRTVLLTNIPPTATLHALLSQTRGGQLVSATLHDTIALTGSMTARLVFLDEVGAAACALNATRSPITLAPQLSIDDKSHSPMSARVQAQHQQAYTHPLDPIIAEAVSTQDATRILHLSNITPQAHEALRLRVCLQNVLSSAGTRSHGIIFVGMKLHRANADKIREGQPATPLDIPSSWSNGPRRLAKQGSRSRTHDSASSVDVTLHFDSIINALRAQDMITSVYAQHFLFRNCEIKFLHDPCIVDQHPDPIPVADEETSDVKIKDTSTPDQDRKEDELIAQSPDRELDAGTQRQRVQRLDRGRYPVRGWRYHDWDMAHGQDYGQCVKTGRDRALVDYAALDEDRKLGYTSQPRADSVVGGDPDGGLEASAYGEERLQTVETGQLDYDEEEAGLEEGEVEEWLIEL